MGDQEEDPLVSEAVEEFLAASRRRIWGTGPLQKAASRVAKDAFQRWRDESGMDVMHRVIGINNSEAVHWLVTHGYFAPPYTPKEGPYAHLAARLGQKTILSVLIEHRTQDFRYSRMDVTAPEFPVCPGCQEEEEEALWQSTASRRERDEQERRRRLDSCDCDHEDDYWLDAEISCACSLEGAARRPAKSPVDMAAEFGHLGCVQLILHRCVQAAYPTLPQSSNLALAVLAGSFPALDFLHRTEEHNLQFRKRGVRDAIKLALVKNQPKMLVYLLHTKLVPHEKVFDGVNFFHVLYTYCHISSFVPFATLPRMTSVLLSEGHDACARFPPRTYPLYSLIARAAHVETESDVANVAQAFTLLFCAGADPDFDEHAYEANLKRKRGVRPHPDRLPQSSALLCLIEAMEQNPRWAVYPSLTSHLQSNLLDALLRHGASLNKIGQLRGHGEGFEGTVLHLVAKFSALRGVNRHTLRLLLLRGADPTVKVGGRFAVNEYARHLLRRMGGEACWSVEECSCCSCSSVTPPPQLRASEMENPDLGFGGAASTEGNALTSSTSSSFDFDKYLRGEISDNKSGTASAAATTASTEVKAAAKAEVKVAAKTESTGSCSCSMESTSSVSACSCDESCSCQFESDTTEEEEVKEESAVQVVPKFNYQEALATRLDVDAFLVLFDRLPHKAQIECLAVHKVDYPCPLPHPMAEHLRQYLEKRMQTLTFSPKSLLQLCSERVWRLCGMDFAKVQEDKHLAPHSWLILPDPGLCWVMPPQVKGEKQDSASDWERTGAKTDSCTCSQDDFLFSQSSQLTEGSQIAQGEVIPEVELTFQVPSSPSPSSTKSYYGPSGPLDSDVVIFCSDETKSPANALDTIFSESVCFSAPSCHTHFTTKQANIFSFHPCGHSAHNLRAKDVLVCSVGPEGELKVSTKPKDV